MAGLHPKWAMDNWAAATQTFKINFPGVHVYEMWADQFVRLANRMGKGNEELKVDVLHLSPPCQFFSPAHTVPGKDDEMNTASLFACGEIIDVIKPRIVTLEQTAGIVRPKHRPYFNALIHMFTRLNFSIRWQVAPLQDWVSLTLFGIFLGKGKITVYNRVSQHAELDLS
jgi:DNA (cytosine-5)-methyltransferase 1